MLSMPDWSRRSFSVVAMVLMRFVLILLLTLSLNAPAQAANVDEYVKRYLDVAQPVALNKDDQGNTQLFSGADLSIGKRLFMQNCLNCHVGGANLSVPDVALSMADLQGATPRRDTIDGLVTYMRNPMVYDGSEENYWCRKVPETWLPQADVEKLAAFVLRAAQKAPSWGSKNF